MANFRTNAGYAWLFIESLYAAVADDLAAFGIQTWVAYPKVEAPPASLEGSRARPLELAIEFNSVRGLWRLIRVIRERDIRGIYLTDRAVWHPAYALLRLAGVSLIVVHDHTSGARTAPTGIKGFVKRLTRRFRPGLADLVLAVSEYVRRRKLEVDLVPAQRVRVNLNSVEIPRQQNDDELRRVYGVSAERPVIVCACRAAEYKGVHHLLRAYDLVCERMQQAPLLIYFGDGPFMDELRAIRESLKFREGVVLAGYQPNVAQLVGGADVCVVPSVWGEAFGLAALEPAARGVAVIASHVGGIPEVVVDRETGRLVPPGDPDALADAIVELLVNETQRREMGERARGRAVERFSRDQQIRELTGFFRDGFGVRTPSSERVPVAAGE